MHAALSTHILKQNAETVIINEARFGDRNIKQKSYIDLTTILWQLAKNFQNSLSTTQADRKGE